MWEILLQGQVPSMGVADPTTQTHENSQSQHLKRMHGIFQGSLSKICHFVSGPHACMKFRVSIRPFSLCFNTDWLQSIQLTTLQLSAVLWRTMPTFCLMGHKHTYILLVWQSSCKNHLPFDKFISSWYVTKNMTILFLAQRFQIIASSNFLTQPPKCLLRFCPEAKLYSSPLHQHPPQQKGSWFGYCVLSHKNSLAEDYISPVLALNV